MKKEMKSNPFDVILQAGIDYLRSAMFNIECYNEKYDSLMIDNNSLHERTSQQYEILSQLSKEEINILKEDSIFYKYIIENSVKLNKVLCELIRNIPTEYSYIIPPVSINTEKIIYGDSGEAEHMQFLRALVAEEKDIMKYNNIFRRSMDYLIMIENNDLEELKYPDFLEEKEFISKHNLTISDLRYITSFIDFIRNKQKGATFTEIICKITREE